MSEYIGPYQITEPLTTHGAGFSKWGFGSCGGKTFFLKEFLSPVYPDESLGLSPAIVDRRRRHCEKYEEEKRELFSRINRISDGNVLKIEHFFRVKNKYYIAARAVGHLAFETTYGLDWQDKILLLRIFAQSLERLHREGLIHGDLKPDNLLIYQTHDKKISVMITDVDNGMMRDRSLPKPDTINVDQTYMAPETYEYILEKREDFQEKIDVFAAGIIFTQILTGELPVCDRKKYPYPFSCVLDGQQLDLEGISDEQIRQIVADMLIPDPDKRSSMQDVYGALTAYAQKKGFACAGRKSGISARLQESEESERTAAFAGNSEVSECVTDSTETGETEISVQMKGKVKYRRRVSRRETDETCFREASKL